jgi:hypothetical protein
MTSPHHSTAQRAWLMRAIRNTQLRVIRLKSDLARLEAEQRLAEPDERLSSARDGAEGPS